MRLLAYKFVQEFNLHADEGTCITLSIGALVSHRPGQTNYLGVMSNRTRRGDFLVFINSQRFTTVEF